MEEPCRFEPRTGRGTAAQAVPRAARPQSSRRFATPTQRSTMHHPSAALQGPSLGSTVSSPPPPCMSRSSCCSPEPPRAAESKHKLVCTFPPLPRRPRAGRPSMAWRVFAHDAAAQADRARAPVTTTRRAHAASLLLGVAAAAAAVAVSAPARAVADESGGGEEAGVLGAIKSIFDPNERTKAGKVLPKAYLKAAREVVRTLRESLEEEDGGGDVAKFRRNADAAKESIREFLGGWRGQQAVAAEESYVALEKAIRSLAEFYSRAGPFASLPQDVKNKILDELSRADAYL